MPATRVEKDAELETTFGKKLINRAEAVRDYYKEKDKKGKNMTKKISLKYAQLPVTSLSLDFLIQVVEPIECTPPNLQNNATGCASQRSCTRCT